MSASEAPFMQKPTAVLDTAFSLYGFLPEDTDVRWNFLERYADLKADSGFERINFANAWGATYLSETASYRRGFVTTINPENSLQLERALDNITHVDDVTERFDASQKDFEKFDIELVLTDLLTSDPTQSKPVVTPCPEALFQLRLQAPNYLGRVGFNLHTEAGTSVMSIVNVQGVPGGAEGNHNFTRQRGISPFNLLVQRALAIAEADIPGYETRGIINPSKGNSQLYWGVFSEEAVPMFRAKRKPASAG